MIPLNLLPVIDVLTTIVASKFDIPVGESDEERDLEMYTSPTDGDVLNDAAEFSIEL